MVLRMHLGLSKIVIYLRRDGMQATRERIHGQSHAGRFGSLASLRGVSVAIVQQSPYPGAPQVFGVGIALLHFTIAMRRMISQWEAQLIVEAGHV